MRKQYYEQNKQNINNEVDQYHDNQDINNNFDYRDNYNDNRQYFDDDRFNYDDNQNKKNNNNRTNYKDNQYRQNNINQNNYNKYNNNRNNYDDNLYGQNNNNRDNYNDNQYNQNNNNDNLYRQNNRNNNYNDNQYIHNNNNRNEYNEYNDNQYRQNTNNRKGYNDIQYSQNNNRNENNDIQYIQNNNRKEYNDNQYRQNNNRNEYNGNQYRKNNNNNRSEGDDSQYEQNNNKRSNYNDSQFRQKNNNNRNEYDDSQYRKNNNNNNRNNYNDSQYRQNNNNNRINNITEQNRQNNNIDLNNNTNKYRHNNNYRGQNNNNPYRQNNNENDIQYQKNEFNQDHNNINFIPNYKVNNIINERNGKLDYLTSPITASIIEYVDKNIDNSQVIFYRIKVTDHINNKSWTVEKRYNDFVNIHKKLSINFSDMPDLPGKTFFKVTDFAQIKKRKDGLQNFVQSCVNRKDIFSSLDFKNFLEIKEHAPHLCANNPELVGAFSITQTVRDFQYLPEEKILFLCSAELNYIERAESKIADLKNSKDISNPQGFAYIYSVEESYNKFSFKEVWKKKFKGRVKSIYYDKDSNLYFIGRTDGFISVYSLDKQSNFKIADLVVELKNHLSSVTGMWFDSYDKKLYSVSTDKRFISSELNNNKKLTEINKSQNDYTRLKPDIKNYLLITATEGGVVDIYSYKNFPPNKISTTSIFSLGNIRDFYINNIKNYIYTCDTKGKISILDFSSSNTKSCLEISQFRGKNPLRNIIYDENKKNLITGDEIGNITIWCLKTGQPIFSWNAHPNSSITKLCYDRNEKILVSGAKDKSLKFWKFPNEWINEDVVKFENEGLKNINNEIARRRIKAKIEFEEGIENDFDSDLSQEDDLNGWNYRKDK